MSRRVGAWTLGEFVLFNVMTLLEIIGLIVTVRGHPLVGGPIVLCAAMVIMALGLKLRARIKRARAAVQNPQG